MQHDLPDLESALAAIDFCDYETVDWPRVQHSTYLIHQHLRYEYPGPIQNLQQRLMILPPAQHGNQRLIDHRLVVTNPSVEIIYKTDRFGNTEINISIPSIEQAVDFEAWILVKHQSHTMPYYLPTDQLAHELYTRPSGLTEPDTLLYEIAEELKGSGKQGIDLANLINSRVFQTMTYSHDVTNVLTTAAQALALKQGVCQDYAHIMVTLCRLCSLPARYISGHLLGEGGTHAWVEVLLPVADNPAMTHVIPLDPTHGRPASIRYVTIAAGSDYSDVAPTSGTYSAAYTGQLIARKRVDLATFQYAHSE